MNNSNNSWILWSVGAIVLTAAITVAVVGGVTGNWPWTRGQAAGGSSVAPTGQVTPGDTNGTEDTAGTEDTNGTEDTTPQTKPGTETTDPTKPETTDPTTATDPTAKPTDPTTATDPTTKPTETTQPEETEPEQTQPTTKPTEPEEDEDEGGGEKPSPVTSMFPSDPVRKTNEV